MHEYTTYCGELREQSACPVGNALLFPDICTGLSQFRWDCFHSWGPRSPRVCCAPVGDIHFVCNVAGNFIPHLHPHESKASLPPQLLCLPAPCQVRSLLTPANSILVELKCCHLSQCCIFVVGLEYVQCRESRVT